MNRREAFERTAESLGLALGRGVRGKGTEVFGESVKIADISRCWIKDEEEWKDEIREILKRDDLEDLEALYIYYRDNKTLIPYKFEERAAKRVNVKEFLEEELKHPKADTSIVIATKRKLLGYISLSHYDVTDYYDMVKFAEDVLELKREVVARDVGDYLKGYGLLDPDTERDYATIHGSGYLWESEAEYLDGRLNNYNSDVVEEFWNYGDEYLDFIDRIDKDDEIIVAHRKGKDWYISPAVHEEEVEVYFVREGYGLDSEYETFYVAAKNLDEKIDAIVKGLSDIKRELEIKGYIYNFFGCDSYDHTMEPEFNMLLVEKATDCTNWDCALEAVECVDWERIGQPESVAKLAIEKMLRKHLDKNRRLFGVYKHIELLRKYIAKERAYLTISTTPGTDVKLYAIKLEDEEYHFWLWELFNGNYKEFADEIIEKLKYRLERKREQSEIYEKAKMVFVGVDDSIQSGNCKPGTEEFIRKLNIDTNKIGGVRGDVLLAEANAFTKPFVERAVAQALKRVGLLA